MKPKDQTLLTCQIWGPPSNA